MNATVPARRVSERLAAINESATLAVDAKAKALKAAGRPVIGFGAGEPDFPTPEHIVEAAARAARDPKNHRYTPTPGLPELREAVAASISADCTLEVPTSSIVVTNGGKQAVFEAFSAIVDPGDEVILPAPYWVTYVEVIRFAGGTPVEVFAGADADYKVSVEQLEAARTDRTKALLLCSPSNPTGSVYSAEEMRAIGQWAAAHGIWIISDEIYSRLTYDGVETAFILRECPELAEQTILLGGVAKTYAMTGWRVGWMAAPADVVKAVSNMQAHTTSNVNNVAQQAALAALTGPQDVVTHMRDAFNRRRHTIVAMMRDIEGIVLPEPTGAFYVFPDVRAFFGRDIAGRTATNSTELATIILEEAEVATVPSVAFGADGYLRLSYALGDDDLAEGMERIQKLLA